jgi:hypothetical protein
MTVIEEFINPPGDKPDNHSYRTNDDKLMANFDIDLSD